MMLDFKKILNFFVPALALGFFGFAYVGQFTGKDFWFAIAFLSLISSFVLAVVREKKGLESDAFKMRKAWLVEGIPFVLPYGYAGSVIIILMGGWMLIKSETGGFGVIVAGLVCLFIFRHYSKKYKK